MAGIYEQTFCLVVDHKATTDAEEVDMMMIGKERKDKLPEILICCQEIAPFVIAGKAHTVGVGFENLIPAPQHISVHVEVDRSFSAEMQAFVEEDSLVARRNGSAVDGLGIGTLETEEDCLGCMVAGARK